MRGFVSVSIEDSEVVGALYLDLVQAGVEPSMDYARPADVLWWAGAMEAIRSCELFIFVVSAGALRSRACIAQLAYALALRRPLLPILVRDVPLELAPRALADTQMVDYRSRTVETAISLAVAVAAAPPAPPLPDPAPPPPECPRGADAVGPRAEEVGQRDYPRARLMFGLGLLGPLTVPLPLISLPVLIVATRALKRIDAQPGMYRNRDVVAWARTLGVVGCVWTGLSLLVFVVIFAVYVGGSSS